ncbi:DUF302 domain-containing protein [Saliphagus sp. LR7]|uniref:DUF302 domain-containing protein n=1 Tax=Saliphagus sp. LR7 TaxID=2282654 RepID=UPI000DF7BE60|nr:DUF302 domain-containing protein [Saliphagus sp. LR7]
MSDADEPSEPAAGDREVAPAASEALHTTLPIDFEDAVPFVQVEHELAGFETVTVTRLDEMIAGMLDEEVDRTALLVTCHPEIARDALAVDRSLSGLLPCTTAIYEREGDDAVHVHHVSATKAMRDLGCAPADAGLEAVIERTGELMETVWENVEENAEEASEV